MKEHSYFVYILFNKRNGTLYVGMTNDIVVRMNQHKSKKHGFTAKYSIDKLGYIELFKYVNNAIAREKQIKGGSREDKLALIQSMNPNWLDLNNDLINIIRGITVLPVLEIKH